jgi:hypothetical protein
MASGDEKAASQAGHMAAPTSNANAQVTLAKGEPSTQGAKRKVRFWAASQLLLLADCVDLVSDEHVLPGRDRASGRRCVWPALRRLVQVRQRRPLAVIATSQAYAGSGRWQRAGTRPLRRLVLAGVAAQA